MAYNPMRGLKFTDAYAVADDIIKYVQSSGDDHAEMRDRIVRHIGQYKAASAASQNEAIMLRVNELKINLQHHIDVGKRAQEQFHHSLSGGAK